MKTLHASRFVRLAASIALAISSVVISPQSAVAAPGQPEPSIAVRLSVTLVTPFTLTVYVDAECQPSSSGSAVIDVIVSQPLGVSTLANEGEGFASVPCDGNTHGIAVTVSGGPYHVGDADAFAQIIAGSAAAQQATDARKVVIVQP